MSIRNNLLEQIYIAYGGTSSYLTRNEYLAQINAIIGGTTRNPDNRDMILEDILAKLIS